MSVNDEGLVASSDSFWEVDQYKRTVKRHEDGFKLCNELMTLIQERAELEKAYAKSLKAWSHKWGKAIEQGPEYGTMEAACKGALSEADGVADLHITVRERLLNEVQSSIKAWRNENFTKKLMGPSSGTKELEDLFKKAQKPWAKRYAKAMKAKKDYHTACKLEKTAIHQESNARNDSAVSPDQQSDGIAKDTDKLPEKPLTPKERDKKMKKLQDKAEKCKRDVENTREKYEAALNDLNSYNAKYMEDMTEVFNRAQDAEEKRLVFFKEMLFGIQKCVDLSDSVQYKQILQQFFHTVGQSDHTKDLRWWSQNHGVDMPMNWPTFEEYSPDLHDIVKRRKPLEQDEGGITLRKINMEKHHSEFPEYSPELHDISKKHKKGAVPAADGITLTAISRNDNPSQPPAYDNYSTSNSVNNEPPSYQSQLSQNSQASDTQSKTAVAPPAAQRDKTVKKAIAPSARTATASSSMAGTPPVSDPSTPEYTPPPSRASMVSLPRTPCGSRKQSYDDALNPFADDDDDNDDDTKDLIPPTKEPGKSKSLTVPLPARPPRPLSMPPKSPKSLEKQRSYDESLNPFADDDELATPIVENDGKFFPKDEKDPKGAMIDGVEVKFRILAEGEDDENDISIVAAHKPEDVHKEDEKKCQENVTQKQGTSNIVPDRPSRKDKKPKSDKRCRGTSLFHRSPSLPCLSCLDWETLEPPVLPPLSRMTSYESSTLSNTFDSEDSYSPSVARAPVTRPSRKKTSNGGSQNPFGEDEWDEYATPEIDESKGVPVRALYDYNGQEDDELTFKAGDIFMKLLDADEQGWCTGKKDTKTGLYPNNYVELA